VGFLTQISLNFLPCATIAALFLSASFVMHPRKLVVFIAQAITVGLALAFLLTLFWPGLLRREATSVEVREAAEPAALSSGGPVSYAAAVDRAAPAVVNINTAKVVTVKPNPLFKDPIFQQFFGQGQNSPRQRVERSLGSGVIFSDQGYILTNHHVIGGADAIQVFLRDGRSATAKVIGGDPETDLAVLKIDLKNLPAITLAKSERVRVGDVVLAIGNPFGVGQTVTMGIVSATGRSALGINTFENFIQTDAAINPGNSGGALVDAHGNLIGINTVIFSQTGGSVGIGFAIPTSLAKGVMEQIIEHGRPLRGWLGIEAQMLTPELLEAYGLKKGTEGLVITALYRDGPAHKAGVEPGDILVTIDGKKIVDAREVLLTISNHKPGEHVRLELIREGKPFTVDAIAAERPTPPPRADRG
jgi:serine protease DegS